MKVFVSIFFFLFIFQTFGSSQDLNGTWQGVIVRNGISLEKGTLLYLKFEIIDGVVTGRMREELYETEFYSVKKINGKFTNGEVSFKQLVIEKSKKTSRQKWCRVEGVLKYDSLTGYLTGNYESYDCKRNIGKIILYKADFEFASGDNPKVSHIWFDQFVTTYKDGLNAPEIRKIERENFEFEPVFFDFDESDIRIEHNDFLDGLIKVVKGHSDLRVKVTGNTDANGSDKYNDGLSKRRAEAIINYFVERGLSADRLEFDFKGEKNPADTNATPEGRQRNRRVDFQFI